MSASSKARTILVVPHTHWDRDWYWPLERFRVKLLELFDVLMGIMDSHEQYRFTFDGQVILLEDYLEARPEARGKLKRYARQGRIHAGPMYVLSDLYCTGGEALIRNVLLGLQAARDLGCAQEKDLHMPDTFGLTPSIPMIAAGFEIPVVTFMRGMRGQVPGATSMTDVADLAGPQVPPETRMFIWTSADGSSCRVFRLRDGYANAARLGVPPGKAGRKPPFVMRNAVKKLRDAARKQDDDQGEPCLLLAGVDHQIPQPQLPEAMEKAQTQRLNFRFASLDDLAEAVCARNEGDMPTCRDEFHGSGGAGILGGTISSRVYLKQDNAAAERELIGQAETSDALCLLMGIDDAASASIGVGWRHLLKVHPHDDICGCSVDPVHRDNEYWIRQARDVADAVRRRMWSHLVGVYGGQDADDERYAFGVFPTQLEEGPKRLRARLDFEGRYKFGDIEPPEAYAVVDEQGREVPFRELYRGETTEHPHPTVHVEMEPPLKPTTFTRFFLEPREHWPLTDMPAEPVLENDRLRVVVEAGGSVTLTDKASGVTHEHVGLFSNEADVGCTYDFADIPGAGEHLYEDVQLDLEPLPACSGLQGWRASGALPVPACSGQQGRSDEWVDLPVTVEWTLGPGADHLQCRLNFENTARDHRLRWNVPVPGRVRTSRAGLKFNEILRPVRPRPKGKTPPRIHPIHPADHFVAAETGSHGLAVFSEFPFNYELVSSRQQRLALTLLRAVGILSTRGNSVKKPGAGPETPTPEAQCLGRRFEMRFAVRPFSAEESGRLFAEAAAWREEPLGGLIEGFDPPTTVSEPEPVLELLSGRGVRISALKRGQSGKHVVLRLFNACDENQTIRLGVSGTSRLVALGLHEKPGNVSPEARRVQPGVFEIDMPAFGLATYRVPARPRRD